MWLVMSIKTQPDNEVILGKNDWICYVDDAWVYFVLRFMLYSTMVGREIFSIFKKN